MKKGFLILIILVIVILIVIGVFAILINYNKSKRPLYATLGDKAITESNYSICLQLNGMKNTYPMDCWSYIAFQKDYNINLCKGIDNEMEKFNCYTAFIKNRWDIDKEVLCDRLTSSRDKNYCYMVTGVSSKDPSFCDKISSPETPTQVNDCKNSIK